MPQAIAINFASGGTHADIAVRGVVGQSYTGCADYIAANLTDQVQTVTLRINSLGGMLSDGLAIYNLLRAHTAAVSVIIEGVAGSAASVIAMAGDSIAMYANSLMMIHAVRMVECDDWGKEIDTPEAQAAARAFNAALVATYTERTGKSPEEIGQMLAADTWMTADEAVAAGFADRVEPWPARKTGDPAAEENDDAPAALNVLRLRALATAIGIPLDVIDRPPSPAAQAPVRPAPLADAITAAATAAGLADYADIWLLDDSITALDAAQPRINQAVEVAALCRALGVSPAEHIRAGRTLAQTRSAIAAARAAEQDQRDINPVLPTTQTPIASPKDVWAKAFRK